MASNPDIFLEHLIGTTGLRPIQDVQAAQLGLTQQRLGAQQQQQQLDIGQMAIAQAQREAAEEQAFQEDAGRYAHNPTPQGMLDLATRYPKHYQAVKAGWDAQNEAVRSSNLAVLSDIEAALRNGRPDLAAKRMRELQQAERNSGAATDSNGASHYDDEIAAIERGDKDSLNAVHAMTLGQIASITGLDKFASTYGAVAKSSEPKILAPGNRLTSPTGEVLATAPFKPVPVRTRPGESIYEYQPGDGTDTDTAPQGGSILDRMIPITMNVGEGTGGRDRTAGGALITSPKGAQGRMQVMPGTNIDPGFGVTPAQDDSDEERARVGRDYLGALHRRYGDPAKAWAAYNAGPGAVDAALANGGPRWLQQLPAETRRYVARNMAALQRSGPTGSSVTVASSGGTMHKIADGGPVPQYRMLSDNEVKARKLDPAEQWQMSPAGRISQVTHTQRAGGTGAGPRTPDNVYAPILWKIAHGQPITPDEANALAYYRRRHPGSAGGAAPPAPSAPAPKPKYKEGQEAAGPNGQRVVFRGGQWVPKR